MDNAVTLTQLVACTCRQRRCLPGCRVHDAPRNNVDTLRTARAAIPAPARLPQVNERIKSVGGLLMCNFGCGKIKSGMQAKSWLQGTLCCVLCCTLNRGSAPKARSAGCRLLSTKQQVRCSLATLPSPRFPVGCTECSLVLQLESTGGEDTLSHCFYAPLFLLWVATPLLLPCRGRVLRTGPLARPPRVPRPFPQHAVACCTLLLPVVFTRMRS